MMRHLLFNYLFLQLLTTVIQCAARENNLLHQRFLGKRRNSTYQVDPNIKLLIQAVITVCGALHMRAYFDQKDIRGYVEFGQHSGGALTIKSDFNTKLWKPQNTSFKITVGPSIYEDFCSKVGADLHDFTKDHGFIQFKSQFTDNRINIMGRNSVFGHSLTLYNKTAVIACSTILPHSDVIYATADIMSSTIGGKFDFIQSVKGMDTFVYGKLNDVRSGTTLTEDLDVYISADTAIHSTCEPLRQMLNPDERTNENCSKNQEASCAVGALYLKHGPIRVTRGGAGGVLVGVDTNLPLIGDLSIVSHSIVVRRRTVKQIVACARINIAGPLNVQSKFDANKQKGIGGYFSFIQPSPYHFTSFKIELKGLKSRVGGYHVHRFPIADSENPCSGASVGGHVNTWNVDIKTSPSPGNGSLDKYEVGDLSGRYGTLVNKDTFSLAEQDANLPLYGLHTILGRSMVLHEVSGARFVCADIEPDHKLKVSTLANFTAMKDSPLRGYVHLVQYVQLNGITTRTIAVVDVKHKDGTKTSGHRMQINNGPTNGEQCPDKNTVDGSLFNPMSMNTKFTGFCNERNPFLCRIGDLSGKVGEYDMKLGKYFVSDENLPIIGPMTSMGRSIKFFKKGGSTEGLACTNLKPEGGRSISKLTFDVQDKKLKNDNVRLHAMLMKVFEFEAAEKYRINSLKTYTLDNDDEDCFRVEFFMIDTSRPPNAGYFKCGLQEALKDEKKMSPFKPCARKSSSAMITIPSFLVVLMAVVNTLFI